VLGHLIFGMKSKIVLKRKPREGGPTSKLSIIPK
jgi:hypothetical protein